MKPNVSAGLDLRVGDAERDQCLAALAEHHMAGRLDVNELDRRQQAAFAAVSASDLDVLLSDLPSLENSRRVSLIPRPHTLDLSRVGRVRHLWPAAVLYSGAFVAQGGSTADWWHINDDVYSGLALVTFGYATHWVATKFRR